MALYFPPNQANQTQFPASNGVLYEYDSSRNTWTSISTGSLRNLEDRIETLVERIVVLENNIEPTTTY